MEWNKNAVDQLRQLSSERYSANEMAKVFNVTRGSIVGKCRRENIPLLSQTKSYQKNESKINKGNGITVADRIIINANKKHQFVEVKNEKPNVDCPPSKNIPFENNKGCRDITDIALSTCCGHQLIPGKSYCDYHYKLYTTGIPQRRNYGT